VSAITKERLYSFEDFCFLVKDGDKADLIDGVIYMSSPDNTDANRLNVWLVSLVFLFVDAKDLGEVFVSRVAYRLGDSDGPEPDLGFVRKDRLHLVRRGHLAGRPDLAMEIVSPDSIERDYVKKHRQFERARIPEYWIIDEIEKKVTLLQLGRDGRYREVRPLKGVLRSKVLPGFWLRTSWLWQQPLPKMQRVLNQILKTS
jgi:Uma2 family endonuclease